MDIEYVYDPVKATLSSVNSFPLVHKKAGINADVVIGGPGTEDSFRSRAEPADLGGTIVPVAAAEDVVAMKILSGRSKDREDVIAIIAAQGRP